MIVKVEKNKKEERGLEEQVKEGKEPYLHRLKCKESIHIIEKVIIVYGRYK